MQELSGRVRAVFLSLPVNCCADLFVRVYGTHPILKISDPSVVEYASQLVVVCLWSHKNTAYTRLGINYDWVVQHCHSWLSLWKEARISHGEKSHWDNKVKLITNKKQTYWKKRKRRKKKRH